MNFTLPKDDYKLLYDIIKPDLKRGPYICGGSVMHWLENKESVRGITDIDIYCKDDNQQAQLELQFKSVTGMILKCETQRALTFSYNDYMIQIIKMYTGTVETVLNSFDITACKVATDGFELFAMPNAIDHIQEKKIEILEPKPESVRRVIKYLIKGYSLDDTTFDRIAAKQDTVWKYGYESANY